jgi:hypothetical protein
MMNNRVKWSAAVVAAAIPVAAGGDTITVYELASDFSWGYRCGVKQPLGAYKNGLSVHELVKSNYPEDTQGNPDNLLWVDEIDGVHGISERPTDEIHSFRTTPGGFVAFSGNGTLWYTLGARPPYQPLSLYSSLQPYDPFAFVNVLFNYDTLTGSTTPCVAVHDPWLLLYWRHGHSTSAGTTARLRRYNINGTFSAPDLEVDLGQGMDHESLGRIGIEQLWPRHDPRFGYTFATWQYFRTETEHFGSNPFLYTDDDGDTWRTADGTVWTQPFDHIAHGDSTKWYSSDLGVSPGGVFWMTLRSEATGSVLFCRFDGEGWTSQTLAEIDDCKPFACGVTLDHIVFVYADVDSGHLLQARLSATDGDTWSAPIIVDDLGAAMSVAWVSFVQPADGYPDNRARFFYGYARAADGSHGLRYQNNIRWLRLDADGLGVGDIDGDGVVGVLDFLILLAEWGPCADCDPPQACPADLDGDCIVGILDFLLLLGFWGPCP